MAKVQNNPIFPLLEWPTWLVIVTVYCSWILLFMNFQFMNWWIAIPLLTLTLTLHSSMVHELIHGHPTTNQTINYLIGFLPIALIYPYTIFKETHLKHHDKKNITYPGTDPESFFHTQSNWDDKGTFKRSIAWVNMTLLGRLLLGPGTSFIQLAKCAIDDIRNAKITRIFMWINHYLLIFAIVYVAHSVFHIPYWLYIAMAYVASSLIQLRSFFEHQPKEVASQRSVVQDASLPMRLLFLNNNYHYVHHQNPTMPWFQLKQEYIKGKDNYLTENGNFYYRGYSKWLRFLIKPVHSPVHPFYSQEV